MIRVAKTKALISFAVTAKVICAFVFAYANCWFSHAMTQLCVVDPDSKACDTTRGDLVPCSLKEK